MIRVTEYPKCSDFSLLKNIFNLIKEVGYILCSTIPNVFPKVINLIIKEEKTVSSSQICLSQPF